MIFYILALLLFARFFITTAIKFSKLPDQVSSRDSNSTNGYGPNMEYTSVEFNFLRLCIMLMKADGVISESEKVFTRKYMSKMFGEEKANLLFKGNIIDVFIKEASGNPELEVINLKKAIRKDGWFSIIQFLYGLAASDGRISIAEVSLKRLFILIA